MKIFIYLDESGSIHKNSSMKYFAVGGYFTLESDRLKIISRYKEINLKYKKSHNMKLGKEIKGRDMSNTLKKKFFHELQSIKDFYGVVKIFDKSVMRKSILTSNIFYNYAVRLIIDDCIVPILSLKGINESVDFVFSLDNRNLALNDMSKLENYLYRKYRNRNFTFTVTYYDSKTNYGVQIADLIVNTFYNYFNGKKEIEVIINMLLLKKFRISVFPGGKIIGRRYKID